MVINTHKRNPRRFILNLRGFSIIRSRMRESDIIYFKKYAKKIYGLFILLTFNT
jgi:hypothetical protein